MKKFTLLLCLFVVSVMMPQVVMAEELNASSPKIVKSATNDTLTITSAAAGELYAYVVTNASSHTSEITTMKGCTKLVLKGKFNSDDLDAIKQYNENETNYFAFTSVDMANAQFIASIDDSNYMIFSTTGDRTSYPNNISDNSKSVIGTLYESINSQTKRWVAVDPSQIPSDYYFEPVSFDENDRNDNDNLNYNNEYYIRFPQGTECYQLKLSDNQYEWVKISDNPNDDIQQRAQVCNNEEEVLAIENPTLDAWAKVYVNNHWVFYQYKQKRYWQKLGDNDTPLSTPKDVNDVVANKENYLYVTGWPYYFNPDDYANFVTEYHYYKMVVSDYSWQIKALSNQGDSYSLDGIYATQEALIDNLPSQTGHYAVVGGQEQMYTNSAWGAVVDVYNYSSMKFTYWASTLQTVVLPADVTASQLPNDVLRYGDNLKCDHVTRVEYGETFATIDRSKEKPVDIYGSEVKANELKAILCKKNFFDSNNIICHYVTTAGYDEVNQKYTAPAGDLDVSYINESSDLASGVKLLDLSLAVVTKENLSQLTRDDIEYIILPGDKDKDFVCDSTNYYSGTPKALNMSNLKAIVSSEGTTLVAHVVVPGSLAQGRCYATGLKDNTAGHPAVVGLTSVTLSGSLNLSDITVNEESNGLSGEKGTIVSMDLEKAIFPNNNDMNFLSAGFQGNTNECVLKKISLPTDPRMIHIPVNCFRNIKSLDSLCIPFNYQYIHDGALYDTNIEHLTTTDSIGGVVIDNGMYTYTLSANIKQLGDKPEPLYNASGIPEESLGEYVFPKENGVTEFYTLATKVPICYRNTFSYDLTFGYGGQDQQKVYGRDRFFNNGDRKKSFVVLRYPSEEVFNRRKAKGKPVENDTTINGKTISGYRLMEMKYTDVTKVYTKKDQTGAVDANGNPLLWPSRTEGNRAYNQATVGALWDDWGKEYTGENGSEINDTETGDVPTNSRSMARRFEGESKTLPIDLTQGMSAEGVTRTQNGTNYTFTPTQNVKNMFQYLNMPVTYDGVTYNKIVVKFADKVPAGFNYHAYGERGVFYSLEGKTEIVIRLNGNPIDDFTIFNWDDGYWTDNGFVVADSANNPRSITITEAYFTTEEYEVPVNVAKYKHDKGNGYPFDLVDYLGWHQIVLNQAAYYEPVVKKENDKIKREYEQIGYCTFCIPYDMTYSQMVKMLGVPKSAGNVENYLNGAKQDNDVLPDIRQLISVTRTKGVGSANNEVLFRLTKNLVKNNGEVEYLNFKDNNGVTVPERVSAKDRYAVDAEGNLTDNKLPDDADPRCIVGGRPYIINAYKLKGETIDKRNLGMYIMKRYADEFSDSASCVNNGKDYYEQLNSYTESGSGESTKSLLTMRFAKPYEGHKVQAVSGDNDESGALEYEITNLKGDTETQRYYYTMVGQFWEQDLPQYGVYMTQKGEWKRYTNTSLGFKWDPYKCVIMATPDVISTDYVCEADIDSTLTPRDEATKARILEEEKIHGKEPLGKPDDYETTFNHFGGGFRDIKNCYFPMNYKGTLDWIPAPMTLSFFGRDDKDFNKPTVHQPQPVVNGTRYIFTMDEEDEIIDYGEKVTKVKTIDTLDGVPQLNSNSKVYSLSGQYMGTSTDGLSKGVYIVGGQKIVVE